MVETALRIVEREEMADEEWTSDGGDFRPPGRPKRWKERAIAMLQVMPYFWGVLYKKLCFET